MASRTRGISPSLNLAHANSPCAPAAQRHVRPCRRATRPVLHRPLSDVCVDRAQQGATRSRARRRGGGGGSSARRAGGALLPQHTHQDDSLPHLHRLPVSLIDLAILSSTSPSSSSSGRPPHVPLPLSSSLCPAIHPCLYSRRSLRRYGVYPSFSLSFSACEDALEERKEESERTRQVVQHQGAHARGSYNPSRSRYRRRQVDDDPVASSSPQPASRHEVVRRRERLEPVELVDPTLLPGHPRSILCGSVKGILARRCVHLLPVRTPCARLDPLDRTVRRTLKLLPLTLAPSARRRARHRTRTLGSVPRHVCLEPVDDVVEHVAVPRVLHAVVPAEDDVRERDRVGREARKR